MNNTEELIELQKTRLQEAGVTFNAEQLEEYLNAPDVITLQEGENVPPGYKLCGKCHECKKYHLFNRNSSSKINCTGNCKACQKATALKSYHKNKKKRNYKEHYAKNREAKQEAGRKYYRENKEKVLAKQKEYRTSAAGKKVMSRAHVKRRILMSQNKGIPYTREMIIDRDTVGEYPVCCLCGEPITAASGLHMEHLIPIALGGKDCFTNVGCAHEICNLRKTKDAREITVEQVETLLHRAEAYIESHPELFEDGDE